MRSLSYILLILLLACREPAEVPRFFSLKKVELRDVVALLGKRNGEGLEWYGVNSAGSLSLLEMEAEGNRLESDLPSLSITSIPNAPYLAFDFSSIGDTYLVAKHTGKAYSVQWSGRDYFACSENVCYYSIGEGLVEVADCISAYARQQRITPYSPKFVVLDDAGMLVYSTDEPVLTGWGKPLFCTYESGSEHNCSEGEYYDGWRQSDGKARILDNAGNVFRVTRSDLVLEGTIPSNTFSSRKFQFPEADMTVHAWLDEENATVVVQELQHPFETKSIGTGFTRGGIFETPSMTASKKYLYTILAKGGSQRLMQINSERYAATIIGIDADVSLKFGAALSDDLLLVRAGGRFGVLDLNGALQFFPGDEWQELQML